MSTDIPSPLSVTPWWLDSPRSPVVWVPVNPWAALRPRQADMRAFNRFCQAQRDRCQETAQASWRRYVARVFAAQPNEGTRENWRIERRW